MDMDEDGVNELILSSPSSFDGVYEILHYEEGMVYGYDFIGRQMMNIQSNGIIESSGGYDVYVYYRLSFDKERYDKLCKEY